jgi:hypothetical protein
MEIRFVPEMIAQAIMPQLWFRKEKDMTPYLIALALAGLVVIAVWEGLS